MKIIDAGFEILDIPKGEDVLKKIERAARTCYKSEDKITIDSAKRLVQSLLKSGHHSVIEHASATVKVICDRGISHEIVRHRLCAFSQESTRYANYAKEKFGEEITVIRPFDFKDDSPEYDIWLEAMAMAESSYLDLIGNGMSAQWARSVLPNSLKTEIVITANMREWRHIFNLRCSKPAHPQIREVMLPLLDVFNRKIPVLFDDLFNKYEEDIVKFYRYKQ